MRPAEARQRSADWMHLCGQTWAEIGAAFGVTRERARQIAAGGAAARRWDPHVIQRGRYRMDLDEPWPWTRWLRTTDGWVEFPGWRIRDPFLRECAAEVAPLVRAVAPRGPQRSDHPVAQTYALLADALTSVPDGTHLRV